MRLVKFIRDWLHIIRAPRWSALNRGDNFRITTKRWATNKETDK